MRKIIVLSFLSLDGVMQAPGGTDEDTSNNFKFGGWTVPFFDEEAGKLMGEQMGRPSDLLLGRKTFDIFESYWPTHAENWPEINEMNKYVVSTTRKDSTWNNTHFITENVVQKLKELKESNGNDLYVHGSGELIQTLFKEDLVDELWLKIFPVTLGTGKKLFAQGTTPKTYKLTSSKVTSSGVIFANYTKAGEVKTGSF